MSWTCTSSVPFIFTCSGRFEIRQAGQFDDHGSAVWRVCWNITGTILATSGDDGMVSKNEKISNIEIDLMVLSFKYC